MTTATVWTDGSGKTGGPAGIAYVGYVTTDRMDGMHVEGSLELRDATNQQAELLAAAYALHELPPLDHVYVVSDSQYLVKGWNEWPTRKRKRNLAHWARLTEAAARHGDVTFTWTKGHAGTVENERADQLAVAARHAATAKATSSQPATMRARTTQGA